VLPPAGGSCQREPAAQRLHPVGDPDEAGAAGGVTGAAAVVVHAKVQGTLVGRHLTVAEACSAAWASVSSTV
jgi:hypothetical protein